MKICKQQLEVHIKASFLFDRLMGVFKSGEFAATEIFIFLCFYILSVVLSLVCSRRTTAGKKNKKCNIMCFHTTVNQDI